MFYFLVSLRLPSGTFLLFVIVVTWCLSCGSGGVRCATQSTEAYMPHSVAITLFSWAFLMAYFTTKLKSSDNKASSCFRPL
jgi:hypothetical protein